MKLSEFISKTLENTDVEVVDFELYVTYKNGEVTVSDGGGYNKIKFSVIRTEK